MVLDKENIRLLKKDGIEDFLRNRLSPLKNILWLIDENFVVGQQDLLEIAIIKKSIPIAQFCQRKIKKAVLMTGDAYLIPQIEEFDHFLDVARLFTKNPDFYDPDTVEDYKSKIEELFNRCPKHV